MGNDRLENNIGDDNEKVKMPKNSHMECENEVGKLVSVCITAKRLNLDILAISQTKSIGNGRIK